MAVDAGAAEVPGGPRQGTVCDGASTSNRSTTLGIENDSVTKGTRRVDIIDGALDTRALHGSLRELAEQGLSEASRRRICEERAQSVLKALEEGRCDMSEDVLRYVMLLWTGTNNRYRKRVNPPGQDFVKSVSLGVISQHTGEVMTSSMTKSHPALTRVLNLYAQSVCSKDFKWTTITVNDGFASSRHRDSGNAGLSFIKTVGDYHGGSLFTWPSDDSRKTLGSLAYGEAETLDPRNGVYFDGTRAHETQEFSGWRISIVWFVAKRHTDMSSEVSEEAQAYAFRLPSCDEAEPAVMIGNVDDVANTGNDDEQVVCSQVPIHRPIKTKMVHVGYLLEDELPEWEAINGQDDGTRSAGAGILRYARRTTKPQKKVTFEEGASDNESRHVTRRKPGKVPNLSEVNEICRIISVFQAIMSANDLASCVGHDFVREVIVVWEDGGLLFRSGREANDDESLDFVTKRGGTGLHYLTRDGLFEYLDKDQMLRRLKVGAERCWVFLLEDLETRGGKMSNGTYIARYTSA